MCGINRGNQPHCFVSGLPGGSDHCTSLDGRTIVRIEQQNVDADFQSVYTEVCFAVFGFWKHVTERVGISPEVTGFDKVDRILAAWAIHLRLMKLEDKLTEILRRKLSVLNSMWFAKDTQVVLARHKQKPESRFQTTKRSTMPNAISLVTIVICQGKIWNHTNLETEGVVHLVQCLLLFIKSPV